MRTGHQKGIYSINVINEEKFVTGGGNGEFIIWGIEKWNMLNVVYDNERNGSVVNRVVEISTPFSGNILMSCYNGKCIAFWVSESDMDERVGML